MNARHGLTLISGEVAKLATSSSQTRVTVGAPVEQILRQRAFERAHPGSDFTPRPVGGQMLAWVPFGSGGVQFSAESLEELLDQAEEFFDGTESDNADTG